MALTRGDDAAGLFRDGWSCSQAVCCAFAKDFSIEEKTALRLSCALGGGMSHTGNMCGAVSGALVVIGMKYGRTKLDDLASKEKTNELAQQFIREFRRRNDAVREGVVWQLCLRGCSGLTNTCENNPSIWAYFANRSPI